jgi:hypothetical protein
MCPIGGHLQQIRIPLWYSTPGQHRQRAQDGALAGSLYRLDELSV